MSDVRKALPAGTRIDARAHFQFSSIESEIEHQVQSFSALLDRNDLEFVSIGCDEVELCLDTVFQVLKTKAPTIDKVILFPARFPPTFSEWIATAPFESIEYEASR